MTNLWRNESKLKTNRTDSRHKLFFFLICAMSSIWMCIIAKADLKLRPVCCRLTILPLFDGLPENDQRANFDPDLASYWSNLMTIFLCLVTCYVKYNTDIWWRSWLTFCDSILFTHELQTTSTLSEGNHFTVGLIGGISKIGKTAAASTEKSHLQCQLSYFVFKSSPITGFRGSLCVSNRQRSDSWRHQRLFQNFRSSAVDARRSEALCTSGWFI